MSKPCADSSQWRTALLDGTLRLCAVVVLALSWVAIAAPVHLPWLTSTLVVVAVAMVIAALVRGLGYRTRSLVVVLGLHVIWASPVLRVAVIFPNVSACFLLEAVLATLLLGRGAGFAVVIGAAATFAFAALWHGSTPPYRDPGWLLAVDGSRSDVALRLIAVACVIGVAAVLGISHLLRRLERAIAERDESLEHLAQEHTAHIRVLQELERREADFLRARELEVLGRLAGFVVHDFNNALLAIFGGNELARHARSESERNEALEIVQSAAVQAASTAKQLRAFGPRARAETRLLDAGHVARNAERLLRTLLPKNIELSVTSEPTPRIRADEGLLQSALMNLSLNAWDAMRSGGRLDIQIRSGTYEPPEFGSCVIIEVRDTGIGMDEPTVARMFAPFFTTKGPEGTGLGLSSVRQTVAAAGGSVSVRSALGRGTCITLRWPAAVSQDTLRDSPDIEPTQLSQGPLSGSILVVDDDAAVRVTVATYLRRCGLTALEACSRDEALSLASQRAIDVVVTDGVVPGHSVAHFIRELRQSAPGSRILLCSGSDPDDFEAARALVDATLPKPFELEALLMRLRPLIATEQPNAHVA